MAVGSCHSFGSSTGLILRPQERKQLRTFLLHGASLHSRNGGVPGSQRFLYRLLPQNAAGVRLSEERLLQGGHRARS